MPAFRILCCRCGKPVRLSEDVYALDGEWQRRRGGSGSRLLTRPLRLRAVARCPRWSRPATRRRARSTWSRPGSHRLPWSGGALAGRVPPAGHRLQPGQASTRYGPAA
ncbi:hypothetical protein EH183_38330 [Streptomyces sp. CB01881]|nr:hypothetical protein C2142_38330 [Streptomyces sp. CB01881]TYC68723.1 hypothetical protein EH183_38330 [Streptomyces sp. CB01881]